MRAIVRRALPFVAVLPLLFVLGRAVALDDGAYMLVASRILADPLSALASSRFDALRAHPPAFAYWVAAAWAVGGDRETWLHLAVLPFTVAAVVAGVRLAARFAGGSPWATAMWVASPAFLVTAATLTPDVMMLALSLWGLVLYVEGVDADSAGRRRAGAFIAGAAVVVKYPAAFGVVVLMLYPMIARRRHPSWRSVAGLWPAAVPFAVWSVVNALVDDRWHFAYAMSVMTEKPAFWFGRNAIAALTVISAGCVFPVGAMAGWRWVSPASVVVPAAAALATAVVTPLCWDGLPIATTIVTALVSAVGAAIVLGVVRHVAAGDRDDLFLALWLFMHVAFVLTTWTVAVRYMLAALPPLALLTARAMQRGGASDRRRPWAPAAVTIVTLVIGVVVLRADTFWVAQYRDAARWAGATARAKGVQAFYKNGAWGFEYYAQRAGLHLFGPKVRSGDLVVGMRDAPAVPFTQGEFDRLEHLSDFWSPPPPLRLHTMNGRVGAGFHFSLFGPMPMMVANRPAAGIMVWRIRPDAATR